MGRSYWFECSRCGYRAKVSGHEDRGLNFFVQTIVCRDCKQLYDAVIRLRVPRQAPRPFGQRTLQTSLAKRAPAKPPLFQSALNLLPYAAVRQFRWTNFKRQCPVSPFHKVEDWNEPDKCPRCAAYLEKNPRPFRIWD